MPIKFFNLLQDSWNFMRNQWQFSLIAVLLVELNQSLSVFVAQPQVMAQQNAASQDFSALFSNLPVTLLLLLVGILLNVIFILNIHAINQGKYQGFLDQFPTALTKLLPVVVLMVLASLPISFGVAAQFLQQSIIALPLMISGFYIFIKLSLSSFVYLIELPKKSVVETLKYTWSMSRGKIFPLILYCVLYYFVPGTLNAIISRLGTTPFLAILSDIISAFLNVYMLIFSYRFYQAYRQAV